MPVNIKRLSRLATVLETEFPKGLKFSITTWTRNIPRMRSGKISPKALKEGFCGSAACAVGTACLLPEFNRQGLQLSFDGNPILVDPVSGDIHARYSSDAVQMFFGITSHTVGWIFTYSGYRTRSGDYDKKITRQKVAKRIREFIRVADNCQL